MIADAMTELDDLVPKRRLIVCADDYALTPGVSRGIRELLVGKRISATSAMTASEIWPEEAAALKSADLDADIGLHITLTDQVPLGPMPNYAPAGKLPPMGAVFKAGLLRRLPLDEIKTEIHRQFERFVVHYGKPPAHIDGHHHIHQLPGIREIVVDLASSLDAPIWLRVSRDTPARVIQRGIAPIKALMIGGLGRTISRRAKLAGVPTNAGFTGVYDVLGERRQFADLVPRMLQSIENNTLFMCHPGFCDADLLVRDAMTTKRQDEYRFFSSNEWPKLLADSGLQLGPFRLQ